MWEFLIGLPSFAQLLVVCSTYYLLKFIFYYLPRQVLITIRVTNKGWPPSHLNVHGDWKPESNPEKD